jgi:hypothetical protein
MFWPATEEAGDEEEGGKPEIGGMSGGRWGRGWVAYVQVDFLNLPPL